MDSKYKSKINSEYDSFARNYAVANFNSPLQYQILEFCSLLDSLGFKRSKDNLILDAGCGPGRDVDSLLAEGFSALGIDFSESMINIAKELVPAGDFRIGDFEESNEFEPESFCGIWSSASLIHYPKEEVRAILKNFSYWLKPNGALFISLLESSDNYEEKELRIKRFYQNPLKTYFFAINEMLELLESEGFDIWKYRKDFDFDNNWIDVFAFKK